MVVSVPGQVASGHAKAKPSTWTESDIETLISMREQGHSNLDIGLKLKREENAVAVKATRLHLPSRNSETKKAMLAKNPQAKLRACLTCAKTFFSEGAGNRICDPCKSTSAWASGSYSVSYGGGL